MLSDFYPHGYVAKLYGAFRASDGYSERAIVVIDKRRTVRHIEIHPINEQPDNDILFNILGKLEPGRRVAGPTAQILTDVQEEAEPEADVILYCTPWCPDCRRARAYFLENQVNFIEIDITRDRTAAQRVRSWANGYETTPTFKIKDKIIISYDKVRIAKELGIG